MQSKFGVAPFIVSILIESTSSLLDVLNLVTAQSRSPVLLSYYIHVRDSKLCRRITSTETTLCDLLPSQRSGNLRNRPHNFILPNMCTSRFNLFL